MVRIVIRPFAVAPGQHDVVRGEPGADRLDVRRARVLERNEVRGENFAMPVNPEMFDFIEGVYEAPDEAELIGAIISESD